MLYPYVGEVESLQPEPLPRAFEQSGEVAAQSQTAMLLMLGALLGPEEPRAESEGPEAGETPDEVFPEEELADLAIPADVRSLQAERGKGLRGGLLRERFGSERAETSRAAREDSDEAAELGKMQRDLASELFAEPSPEVAGQLIEASMNHPQPLVRVGAASAGLDLFPGEEDRRDPVSILVEESTSEEAIVRQIATTALARAVPDHPRLAELERPTEPEDGDPARTTLLVHGTFARTRPWWQPGGDFHSYLSNEVGLSVYGAADRYDWSGGYSNAARTLAASRLETWVADHGLQGLDVIPHSHGGSVAMEASRASLTMGKLVLLSCPVHARYRPDFSAISDVISIRVRLDLVILADRGGQRFRDPRIRENVLPIWFSHSASHDPDVWRRHNVPSRL